MARVYILIRQPEALPHGLPMLAFSSLKKAKDICKVYFPFADRWTKLERSKVDRRNGLNFWVGSDADYPGRQCGKIISFPVDKGP